MLEKLVIITMNMLQQLKKLSEVKMFKKITRILMLTVISFSLMMCNISFAANENSQSSSHVLGPTKELALSKTSNVDVNAIHEFLDQLDKAPKNRTNSITINPFTATTSNYGAAWPYTPSTSALVNCYGYAANFGWLLDPGDIYYYYGSPIEDGDSVNTVATYVLQDLTRARRPSRIINSATATVNSNEYRMALRVGQDSYTYDYHFMLQCSDGGWCEKQGDANSIYDGNINPSTFSWNLYYYDGTLYKANFYNSATVYFAVKK